jgi:hypothetical protein
VLKCP